jgi:uncharacterized protein YndB with AHSA1/START domain
MSRTHSASRVIAAPPDRVYAALVDPDALAAWLSPAGMSGRFERFDARPGGSYRMVLTYADASTAPGKATADSDIVEARFVNIVPGVRVVHGVDFVSDDPGYVGTMTMTWEVTATDDGTCSRTKRSTAALPSVQTRYRPITDDFFPKPVAAAGLLAAHAVLVHDVRVDVQELCEQPAALLEGQGGCARRVLGEADGALVPGLRFLVVLCDRVDSVAD